jgi:CheY-like chemotaxis protein
MEAIGTLAGGIAHDFNNILGAIVGYSEMIRDDFPPGSPGIHDINQVLLASHRAKDLVKQILAFSRQAGVRTMPIQPATIIRESIKMLRASLPATIVIKTDIGRNVGNISADPTQLHQIMMNLCTNAFHAMESSGGILKISLRNTVLARGDSGLLPNMVPGNYLHLSIEDSGIGMAPEVRKKIFDPFFTTKEVGKGTGLGLSMVYGIIQGYGGSIHCHSTQGKGTIFDMFLPTVDESAGQEVDLVAAAPQGSERILLVDDEEILAEMGKKKLQRLGYQVTARTKSVEALAAFLEQPDSFDMVITDQTMAELTGVDLARQILKKRPDMPIILCTGYSSLISAEMAADLGIRGFIMKPLVKNELAELIRKLFDEKHH